MKQVKTFEVSAGEARNNLSELIERAALAGERFIVSKYGKPKVVIKAVSDEQIREMRSKKGKVDEALEQVFGMWKDREDIKDSGKWVREVREKEAYRLYDKEE